MIDFRLGALAETGEPLGAFFARAWQGSWEPGCGLAFSHRRAERRKIRVATWTRAEKV